MAVVAAALVTLAPFAAAADVYDFTFTSRGQASSFSLESSDVSAYGEGFFSDYVDANGSSISFYNPDTSAGFGLGRLTLNYNGANYYGDQLYAGPNSNPVFQTGTYLLTPQPGTGMRGGSLQISRAAAPGAPAPEVGVGLLSSLAAAAALWFTRRRRTGAASGTLATA